MPSLIIPRYIEQPHYVAKNVQFKSGYSVDIELLASVVILDYIYFMVIC